MRNAWIVALLIMGVLCYAFGAFKQGISSRLRGFAFVMGTMLIVGAICVIGNPPPPTHTTR